MRKNEARDSGSDGVLALRRRRQARSDCSLGGRPCREERRPQASCRGRGEKQGDPAELPQSSDPTGQGEEVKGGAGEGDGRKAHGSTNE